MTLPALESRARAAAEPAFTCSDVFISRNYQIDKPSVQKARQGTMPVTLPYCRGTTGLYIQIMEELFFLVEESPEGGYSARALGTAIFTQGETLDEIKANIRDAIDCHFDDEKPKMIRLHIVRDELLANA